MTRALPLDLAAVADSESAARANASLRLLRWSTWGEGWAVGAAEQEARDLDAMLALDADAPSHAQLAALVAVRLERARVRAEALRAAGWNVASVRVECFGPVPALASDAAPGAMGFVFDRNLGLPTLPGPIIRKLLVLGAQVPAANTDIDPAMLAELSRDLYGDEARLVVFDAMPAAPPVMTQAARDPRWAWGPSADGARTGAVVCVARGTEFEFWFASRDAKLAQLASSHIEAGLKSLGMAGPPPEPEVIPEPEPEPVVEPVVEAPAHVEQAVEQRAAEPAVVEAVAEAPVAPEEPGLTEVPADVATITVRVPSAQYLPNNGRVFVMFVPPDGRDPMKAEEHITAIAMTDELRARFKKKKVLVQVSVDVEAVGNSWRIRGIAL